MANLIVVLSEEEKLYVPHLLKCLTSGGSAKALMDKSAGLFSVAATAKKSGVAGVLIASDAFFTSLMNDPKAKRSNYAGSMIVREGVEFIVLPPLKQLVTVPYAPHLCERYVSKLTQKSAWPEVPAFSWDIGTPANLARIHARYESAILVAIDIETIKDPMKITMVGFCAVWISGASIKMHTTVIPCDFPTATVWIDKFCNLPGAKITQGGKYDNAHLARYGISMYNWSLDTMSMFHCWQAELPKALGDISAYTVRTACYWKDLASSGSMQDKMMYNALDCWNTANAMVFMLMRAPAYARINYRKKFKMLYPAHMCEMQGAARDTELFKQVREQQERKLNDEVTALATYLGKPGFNAGSPLQVKQLLAVLGCPLESTKESELDKVAFKSPWVAFWTSKIIGIREKKKLIGTYLNQEKDFKGRWLFGLHPYGTETGRNSSDESPFWCGQNIQNVPAGETIKQTVIADTGFRLAEVDSEQAESRDTAHIAGETRMIAAVSGARDFHSVNCSAFFAVPYESIYDQERRKTLDKPLRDLGKRVNHGANYVMGANVLVSTMGFERLEYARARLGLSPIWGYAEIAGNLLGRFHKTYPGLEGVFYPAVKSTITMSGMLTGATGWTRRFFGSMKNKHFSNAAIAHGPQSLNAMRLDEAFMDVFLTIAIHPEHSANFRLIAQIHDSIFFQFREGHSYLVDSVKQKMEIPITVTGADKIVRTYTVPAAAKAGKDGQGALRWSECE